MARAEVSRLGGALDRPKQPAPGAADLEERRGALADRTRAALTTLAGGLRRACRTARESGFNKTSTTPQPSSLTLVSEARAIAPRQTQETARRGPLPCTSTTSS